VSPVEILLGRLDGVRKTSRGWSARCPAHEDRSASLSMAEGTDGRALVRCFAGCELLAIVRAVGLEVGDLFPIRLADTTPAGRAAARTAWRESGWSAALGVLAREAAIVSLAARELLANRTLAPVDHERLATAIERIEHAREVLAP
jgi:hypothetical protein